MPIASILTIIVPTINLFLLILLLTQVRHNQIVTTAAIIELKEQYKEALNRIGALEIVKASPPSPNEATKKPAKQQILDENVLWNIPKDVKIAVEGGDSNIPPDFEV